MPFRLVLKFWVGGIIVFAGLYSAYSILQAIRTVLIILLISFFISFALEPAVKWMADRGMRRGAATGVAFLGMLSVVGLFISVMIPLVVDQVQNLVGNALGEDGYVLTIADWVNKNFDTEIDPNNLLEELSNFDTELSDFATDIAGNLLGLAEAVIGALFQAFTVLLFTFYIVADGPKLRRTILSVLPPEQQKEVLRVWEIAIEKTGGFIYSRGLLALSSAIFTYVALLIIGVDNTLALAIWVGVLSQFIPVIGTYLAAILPIVIALLDSPLKALAVLIVLVIYQQIENYLISPRVSRHTMSLHPAISFGSVMVGASTLGAVGALLALPTAAIFQAFITTYINRHEVINSDLTGDQTLKGSSSDSNKNQEKAQEELPPPSV